MSPVLVGVAVVVGLVGGALLPTTAYRLSVRSDEPNRDSCVACGQKLRGGLAGWVATPARCTACGVRLGPPAWLTAAVAAAASALVAAGLWGGAGLWGAAARPVLALPLYLALCVLGVLLAVIDLACKRLPHALVVPAIWASGALFAAVAAGTGQWGALLRAMLGAIALGAVFLLLYLLPGGGLGYGDVKLAVLLGLYLGWLGWREVALGAALPWLLNGPVVLALLVTRRVGRKTSLPFGPAMLAGALLAVLAGAGLDLVSRV